MDDNAKANHGAASVFAEQMKTAPKPTNGKNGYEIRSNILELAYSQVWNEYTAKWDAHVASGEKKWDGQLNSATEPAIPTIEQILETARKLYEFVNSSK